MSTQTAPTPITDWSYPDWLGPGLAALAVIALAVTLVLTAGTSSDDAVEGEVVFDDMTRSEVIERVERINGFTGTSAATSAATSAEPDVPSGVR